MKLQRYDLPGAPHLLACLPNDDAFVWMREREGLAGWGRERTIEVPRDASRFEAVHGELSEVFASFDYDSAAPPVAFASFTFDPLDEGSVVSIPQVLMHRRAGVSWAVAESPPLLKDPSPPAEDHDFRLRYAGSSVPETRWLDAVARAVKEIGDSQLEKVVLARDLRVWSKERFDVGVLLERLAARFPQCYTFASAGLVGATPELLVGRSGDVVSSLVLAGSARRGRSPGEDDAIGAELLASSKDISEHTPSVTSVAEALGPVCRDLQVGSPHLLKLVNVQHIATRITARLSQPVSAVQLAGRLHPSAAICGAPTAMAFDAIRRLEGMERGRYAGPVGWMDANGDGEFGIALRCMEINGTAGRLFAGGGIVPASEPEGELEETRLKFRAVMAALEGSVS